MNNVKEKKIAKCGKRTQSFCDNKFKDCEDCKQCSLVNHRFEKLYKYIDGVKYKLCPRCKEYKKLENFSVMTNRYRSWCKSCTNEYNKINSQKNKKLFIVNEKTPMTSAEVIAYVRKFIKNNIKVIIIKKHYE